MADVNSTLTERGSRYGDFGGHSAITQALKDVMRDTDGWRRLNPSQKESLEMVAHKIGRILNGDPNYDDSWHDIAGYAVLVEKELKTGSTPGLAPAPKVEEAPKAAFQPVAAPVAPKPVPVAPVPAAPVPDRPVLGGVPSAPPKG